MTSSPVAPSTASRRLSAAPTPASSQRPTGDLVRLYLQEIGRLPLLTAEEELSYGRRVQRLMVLLQQRADLAEQLGQAPSPEAWAAAVGCSPAELQQQRRSGEQAKGRMIESNLRLVVSIAKKYQRRNLEFLDLIQEGSMGLERAVEKFDPTRGYRFSTYAYWWIRQAMSRAIAQQSRTIRLPIHITETLNKLKKAQRELSQRLGRSASPEELGAALGLSAAEVREYLHLAQQPLSLDMRVGDRQDTELKELIEDSDQGSPEDYSDHEALKQDFARMLAELSPQHRQVLILRFGLEDGIGLSLVKVGEKMNLSRESIRKLERQAIAQLRRHQQTMRDYLVG